MIYTLKNYQRDAVNELKQYIVIPKRKPMRC